MVVRPQLTDRLRNTLASGRFPDQGRLPPERELATEFGVSRSTLRSALGILEAEGRIWRHVGRGTFVGERPAIDAPALSAVVNQTHPEEVMEVRLVLEPRIAALAARRATVSDIAAMDRCVRKGDTANDVATFELWDGAFHRAIATGAHNTLLLALFDAVNAIRQEAIWGRLKEASLTPQRQRLYTHQHRACIEAIRDRNAADAERHMIDHLEAVQDNMFGSPTAKSDQSRPAAG
jgi:DNA-binding FadR family transcriptional regulator